MKRLILAPHGDDEVLGCGGLIAMAPDDAAVMVMTYTEDRWPEMVCASGVLGHDLFTADFPDGHLGEYPKEVVDVLDDIIGDFKPDELYLPAPDLHQDHIATYEAGMRASRLGHSAGRFYVPRVLLYDIPSYDIALYTRDWPWNVFVEISPAAMERKVEAMKCYASQRETGTTFHPAHAINVHAESIGSQRGLAYAERFALVREVVSWG